MDQIIEGVIHKIYLNTRKVLNMNTYVKENIKKYVELDANPEYAILLNGAWGCGKTYFINELLKESWLNKPKDKEVIKISLYGLNSTKEIENQLF